MQHLPGGSEYGNLLSDSGFMQAQDPAGDLLGIGHVLQVDMDLEPLY